MQKIHTHILGVAGSANSGVAKLLQDLGHYVTGSDQGAYPPATDFLDKHHIKYYDTYEAAHITSEIDQVIIGGNTLHVNPYNPEYLEAKNKRIPIKSWAQLAGELIAKPDNVVVSGTYGKSTITALLITILKAAHKDPSYLIGATGPEIAQTAYVGKSQYSVMEGDEHPTQGFEDFPKFLHYQPKYLIITSTVWDHFNIYPSTEAYLDTYKRLIQKLPSDGRLLLNANDTNTSMLSKIAPCKVHTYQAYFQPIPTQIFGNHNQENVAAAISMARLLSIKEEIILQAVAKFKGIHKRLHLINNHNDTLIYQDFGQHPIKAKAAIDALKDKYLNYQITVIFDTNASILHHPESLNTYPNAFDAANSVIIPKHKIRKSQNGERVTAAQILEAIKQTQPNVEYLPIEEQLKQRLLTLLKPGNILLFQSSGNINDLVTWTQSQLPK